MFLPGIKEEYIAQVSDGIENKATEKLSQDTSRIESHVLAALCKLNEFRLNPEVRTDSGTVPGLSRDTYVENQEPNVDQSQIDPHPDVGSWVYYFRYLV